MLFLTSWLVSISLALAVIGVPIPHNLSASSSGAILERGNVHYGDGTWYDVEGSQSACGWYNKNSDYVVALDHATFDAHGDNYNNPLCGKKVIVWVEDGGHPKQEAKIVDRCSGCKTNDLDMSEALFKATIGDPGIGRARIAWVYADGS
ncbi:hypothetical protein DL93DRAFT_517701 [Clavulina sp. PMI_390]|nr:hypothetical protein DL93DRAFT_517701 [Clavulina sp. PMI_390]